MCPKILYEHDGLDWDPNKLSTIQVVRRVKDRLKIIPSIIMSSLQMSNIDNLNIIFYLDPNVYMRTKDAVHHAVTTVTSSDATLQDGTTSEVMDLIQHCRNML